MELHAVKPAALVAHGGAVALVGVGDGVKPVRHLTDEVGVAHPAEGGVGHIPEQGAVGAVQGGLAVFAAAFGAGNGASGHIGHQLIAVADAQHRNPQIQNLGVKVGGGGVIHAVGAAGEDDALVADLPDLRRSDFIKGLDFGVNLLFPNSSGNQLVVLAAEVQYQNVFVHGVLPTN